MKMMGFIGLCILILLSGCNNIKEPCKVNIYPDGRVIHQNCLPQGYEMIDLSKIPQDVSICEANFWLFNKDECLICDNETCEKSTKEMCILFMNLKSNKRQIDNNTNFGYLNVTYVNE